MTKTQLIKIRKRMKEALKQVQLASCLSLRYGEELKDGYNVFIRLEDTEDDIKQVIAILNDEIK